MFSAAIELFFKQASAAGITEAFLYLITSVFVIALFFSWRVTQPKFTAYAAALMTSLGILGTFIGIVIGLLNFDTQDIDGSIPALLSGLKTAFITSVYGMVGAVLFNILDAVFFAPRRQRFSGPADTKNELIQPQHIFNSLEQQREVMTELHKTMSQVHRGLSGDEEGSLIGQFKLLRADMSGLVGLQKQLDPSVEKSFARILITQVLDLRKEFKVFVEGSIQRTEDFNAKLFSALDSFAEMLSRSATEQIIEALKNVIQDFNKNLTEQFGENFKALDASVQKLVVWQAQHKEQVELLTSNYERGAESLRITQESVSGISNQCENIPASMDKLRDVLEVNQHQIAELQQHLAAFVSMRDAAVAAVPTIQQQIELVGEHLVSSSSDVQKRLQDTSEQLLQGSNEMRVSLEEGAEHFRNSVTTTQQSFNELSNVVKTSSEEMSVTLKDTATELHSQARETLDVMQKSTKEMQSEVLTTVKDLGTQTTDITQKLSQITQTFERTNQEVVADFKRMAESLANELNSLLSKSQGTFDAHMQDAASKTGQTVNAQLKVLEEATAREIKTSMEQMGSSLVTITSRFVQDYQTMVTAMEQVIQTAHRK